MRKLEYYAGSLFAISVSLILLKYVEIFFLKSGKEIWFTEIVFFASLFLLIIDHVKSSSEKRKNELLPVVFGFITFITLFTGIVGYLFLQHVMSVSSLFSTQQEIFSAKQNAYIPLVTTLFDKAEKVNIRQDIDQKYNVLLGYPIGNGSYEGREPVYFIRLKNGKIEKLFQSGNITHETVDTPGEKKVVAMLEGKTNTLSFPEYTCCGGDDIWPDIPFLRAILPERRYLKDFKSEHESILLIRNLEGEIIGAEVLLHGD